MNMNCASMNSLRACRPGLVALTAATVVLAMVSVAKAQQSFKTPQEAAETLVAALRAGDTKAVNAVLGPGGEQIVSSGDAVQDENTRKLFLAAYDVKHSVATGTTSRPSY